MIYANDFKPIIDGVKSDLGRSNMVFYTSSVSEFLAFITNLQADTKRYPFFFIDDTGVSYDDGIVTVDTIILATKSLQNSKSDKRKEDIDTYLMPVYDKFIERLKWDRDINLRAIGELKIGVRAINDSKITEDVNVIILKNYQFITTKNCVK